MTTINFSDFPSQNQPVPGNHQPAARRFEPLLRAEDVAVALAISRSAAYRLMRSGALPVVRFAGTVRVRPADLQRFIGGADE